MTMYYPTATEIKRLHKETGASLMECRKSLVGSHGIYDEAKMAVQKRIAARHHDHDQTRLGLIEGYIQPNGEIGVMVELNTENRETAHSKPIQKLARDIAMHIAAANPTYVDRESVPLEVLLRVHRGIDWPARKGNSNEHRDPTESWCKEHCLLEQAFVKDASSTIRDLINKAMESIGERIQVKRFTRFTLHDQ